MPLETSAPSADSADPARPPTVEDVRDRLRLDILSGRLAPGAVLSQVKLAHQLEVNRTLLREAMRMLQQERLLDAEHNRRVRIAPVSGEDLVDLAAMRLVNEAVALRVSVPSLTTDDLAAIDRKVQELEHFAAFELLEQWQRTYVDVHTLLIARAGSRLRTTVLDHIAYGARYERPLLQEAPINFIIGAREHRAIADATRRGDVDAAVDALAQHVARSVQATLARGNLTFDPVPLREALRLVAGRATQAQGSHDLH